MQKKIFRNLMFFHLGQAKKDDAVIWICLVMFCLFVLPFGVGFAVIGLFALWSALYHRREARHYSQLVETADEDEDQGVSEEIKEQIQSLRIITAKDVEKRTP